MEWSARTVIIGEVTTSLSHDGTFSSALDYHQNIAINKNKKYEYKLKLQQESCQLIIGTCE